MLYSTFVTLHSLVWYCWKESEIPAADDGCYLRLY